MPVRNSSRPVFDVSIWPLNIRFFPPPEPVHRPTTLARPSSTSCQVTFKRSCPSAPRMYSAICCSSPVGLAMLMTSQAIAMISSSRTAARIFSTSLGSRLDDGFTFFAGAVKYSSRLAGGQRRPKIVRIRAKLLIPRIPHPKIVFQPQAAATWPVNPRLNRQNHSFANRPRPGLMRIRRLVGTSSNTVTDRMRRLTGITALGNPGSRQAIQFRKARAILGMRHGFVENFQQEIEQAMIFSCQLSRTHILGQVCPIAIHADPDFQQGRFVFLNRAVSCGCKSRNSLSRPHEREGTSHFGFSLVANTQCMDKPFLHRADFPFFHPLPDVIADMLHRQGCQRIRQTHSLDFL